MPTKDEMMLAARLVHAGVIERDQAEAVLKERDAVRDRIGAPSMFDILVKRELLTGTELAVFQDRALEDIQPFPKYLIHGKLAEGGMSMVYRARYNPLNVEVVLKVMKPELSRQDRFLLRFRREAGILMKLEHPGIVRGYDLAEQERVWYCAMEFAEGRDLQAIVEDQGPLSEIEALSAVEKILEAVEYLDSRGIVHRDIKPGNILQDAEGNCRMIDLGLCMLTGGMKDDGTAGTTVGTVEYLSPEQARAEAVLDVRSDLYAIGATLHHLVTGRVPFQGTNDEETLAMQVLATFRPTMLEKAGASPRLVDLVTRLLAKERDDRPPSVAALMAELRDGWPALHPPAPAPIPLDAVTPAPAPVEESGPAMPKLVTRRQRKSRGDTPDSGSGRKPRSGPRKKRR